MLKKGIFAFPILFYMRIQKCLNNSYYPMKWTILDKIGYKIAILEHSIFRSFLFCSRKELTAIEYRDILSTKV